MKFMLKRDYPFAIVIALLIVAGVVLICCQPGCSRLANKPPDYKRAVYLSSSAIGLDALNNAVEVLVANNQLDPRGTLAARKAILSASKLYVEIDEYLFRGDLNGAVAKAQAVIKILQELRQNDAFYINNPEAKAWVDVILEVASLTLSAFAKPADPELITRGKRAVGTMEKARTTNTRGGSAVYVLELITIALKAQTRINNVRLLSTTAEVRTVGTDTAKDLINKLNPIVFPQAPSQSNKPSPGAKLPKPSHL